MDSSVSAKDEIWFLCVCHHVSNVVYKEEYWRDEAKQLEGEEEKADSSDFFPWPKYSVHNRLGKT
jgi:hypothetical protein